VQVVSFEWIVLRQNACGLKLPVMSDSLTRYLCWKDISLQMDGSGWLVHISMENGQCEVFLAELVLAVGMYVRLSLRLSICPSNRTNKWTIVQGL